MLASGRIKCLFEALHCYWDVKFLLAGSSQKASSKARYLQHSKVLHHFYSKLLTYCLPGRRTGLPMARLSPISQTTSIPVTPGWWSFARSRGLWCLLNHHLSLVIVLLLLLSSSPPPPFLPSGILSPSCVRSSCTLFPTRANISLFTLAELAGRHALATTQSPKDDPFGEFSLTFYFPSMLIPGINNHLLHLVTRATFTT